MTETNPTEADETSEDMDGFLPSPRFTPGAFPAAIITWAFLKPGEAQEAMVDLADWVGWLVERYSLDARTVPPCWDYHGALVEELSALRISWITAQTTVATGDMPLQWHQAFALSRQRLADWVSRTGCRPGEHRGAHQ